MRPTGIILVLAVTAAAAVVSAGPSLSRAAAQLVAASQRNLWVLAIGVGRYADPGLTLSYAEADARAIADSLTRQQEGPLYGAVRTKVLIDAEVTRASVLQSLESFLGQAAPTDIGLIYMAGHGMRDAATDSYYFLPATASPANLVVEGLDMTEFDRQVRRLQRNIGSLVVMLDTCYAGAVAAGTRDVRLGEDLAARLAPAEGLYILASAQAGEQSRETATLGHGAFTKALLDGIAGEAADADGLIRVLGLASYAARIVPQLTEGKQHPYYRIVGGNPVLAANMGELARITPPPLPVLTSRETPPGFRRERIAVMDFENLRNDPAHRWMEKALCEEFTTVLNVVTQLDVYAEPEVRFVARGASDAIDAARQAGMAKIVSGAFAVQQDRISITAHVKDVGSLKYIASAKIEGPLDEFFELRSRIVLDLLQHLRLELPQAEAQRILKPSTTNLDARKLLFEAESAAQPAPKQPGVGPQSSAGSNRMLKKVFHPPFECLRVSGTPSLGGAFPLMLRLSKHALSYGEGHEHALFQQPSSGARAEGVWHALTKALAGTAYAAETPDDQAALRAALEGYRATYERRDLEGLACYYAEISPAQKAALGRYLANADELRVEFRDVRITVIGERAALSFTRQDSFVDHQTGDRQQVVVRLTKLFAKGPEGWRIVPEER